MPMHRVVVRPVDCVALGNRSRAGPPESGRVALAYACTWAWRGPAPHRHMSPNQCYGTPPLGECCRDGLHTTVCRHRFRSVRSICLASSSTALGGLTDDFARRAGLYAECPTHERL